MACMCDNIISLPMPASRRAINPLPAPVSSRRLLHAHPRAGKRCQRFYPVMLPCIRPPEQLRYRRRKFVPIDVSPTRLGPATRIENNDLDRFKIPVLAMCQYDGRGDQRRCRVPTFAARHERAIERIARRSPVESYHPRRAPLAAEASSIAKAIDRIASPVIARCSWRALLTISNTRRAEGLKCEKHPLPPHRKRNAPRCTSSESRGSRCFPYHQRDRVAHASAPIRKTCRGGELAPSAPAC